MRRFYLSGNKYYEQNINQISLFSDFKNMGIPILVLIVLCTVLGLLLWIMHFFINDPIRFIAYILLFLLPCLFLISALLSLLLFLNKKNIYANINPSNINERSLIKDVFNQLIDSPTFLDKFLNDLQNNVKQAHGEFPKGFLKVGQSPAMTRLIQLEERWREAEEREAEAQHTKHTPSVSKPVLKTAQDFVGEGKLAAALAQALAQPPLSAESRNGLIQFQSRLSKLEEDKRAGVLESAGYDAKYNTLVRDYLNFLDGED